MQEVFVGVDCGGTNIRVVCGDIKGQIIKQKAIPSNSLEHGLDNMGRIIGIIEELINEIDKELYHVKAIGMGVPGVYYNEEILMCPNLDGLEAKELIKYFKEKLNLNCYILNDVKCAALGEHWLGSSRDSDNSVFLNIGTGISLALILNGKLYMGENNASGEIAYLIPDIGIKFGYVKGATPLEDIVSGKGLACKTNEFFSNKNKLFEDSLQKTETEHLNTKQIFEEYRKGNTDIIKLLDESMKYLYMTIANISILLNPKLIVFGGGVSKDIDMFFEDMNSYLSEMVPFPPLLVKSSLGQSSGLYGALKHAISSDKKT
jgi:glucokinase